LKYAAKPMSATGCFATSVVPPRPLIFSSAASMSSQSTTRTGVCTGVSRASIPPLTNPGSVGMPWSLTGPEDTIV
jgi:hypothetical protein